MMSFGSWIHGSGAQEKEQAGGTELGVMGVEMNCGERRGSEREGPREPKLFGCGEGKKSWKGA